MSFMQNIKKGLFGEDDGYDEQYIDDGPQMVNNNSNSFGADSYEDEGSDSTGKSGQPGRQHQRHHPAQGGAGQARAL